MCAFCRRTLAGLRVINGRFCCESAQCLKRAHLGD
jgi:hypothetical protein